MATKRTRKVADDIELVAPIENMKDAIVIPSTEANDTVIGEIGDMIEHCTDPSTVLPSEEDEDDVMDTFRRIITNVDWGSKVNPTLVSYRNDIGERRYILVEIPEPVLRKAFGQWSKIPGATDVESFIGDVCRTIKMDYPRIYRNVVPLNL